MNTINKTGHNHIIYSRRFVKDHLRHNNGWTNVGRDNPNKKQMCGVKPDDEAKAIADEDAFVESLNLHDDYLGKEKERINNGSLTRFRRSRFRRYKGDEVTLDEGVDGCTGKSCKRSYPIRENTCQMHLHCDKYFLEERADNNKVTAANLMIQIITDASDVYSKTAFPDFEGTKFYLAVEKITIFETDVGTIHNVPTTDSQVFLDQLKLDPTG